MKHSIRLVLISILTSTTLVLFQNCSDVSFSSSDSGTQTKTGGNTSLEVEDPVLPPIDPDVPAEEDPENRVLFACGIQNISDIRINILKAYLGSEEVQILAGDRSLIQISEGFNILTKEAKSTNMVRLVLSDINNQIVDDQAKSYALKTPSAQQSGLKINLTGSVDFKGNTAYNIKFELDPATQIVRAGRRCILKPVLRATSATEVEF